MLLIKSSSSDAGKIWAMLYNNTELGLLKF